MSFFSDVLTGLTDRFGPMAPLLAVGLLGMLLLLGPWLAARAIRAATHTWQRFALALAPIAAASVILGLSMLTVSHLKAEGFWLGWLPYFRGLLLASGGLGSMALALMIIARSTASMPRKAIASLSMLWPAALMFAIWSLVFFVW